MSGPWTAADLGDQHGRTVIITGASSGIGAASARALAAAGARVILGVRDVDKGRRVAEDLPSATVERIDLADLASVRRFADNVADDVDVLINNGGVMDVPYGTTVDGFETQIGTNHLGPFALTGLLLPRIRDRVVTISSQAHRQGRMHLDDPHYQHRRYDPSDAYSRTKLANLLFSYELQRRLDIAGWRQRSIAAHPGLAQSNLLSRSASTTRLRVTSFAQRRLGQSTEAGALPILYAATENLAGGSYVGPDGFYELRGAPKLVSSSRASKDPQTATALWELSEKLTGVVYDFAVAKGM
jgi:NAD(P)-dependent dehydrogenase (short-subunit alcohol dehydrogenase family)